MATKRLPTVDAQGHIYTKHLPAYLQQAALDASYNAASSGSSGSAGIVYFNAGDPTGATDSTTDLLTAISNAISLNYELLIPAGTFLITPSAVETTSAARIRGAGSTRTILQFSASSSNGLIVGPASLETLGPTGWIRDLSLRGPTDAPTTGNALLRLQHAPQFRVSDVQFDRFDIGLDLVGNCMGSVIENVRMGFGGNLNVGINLRTGNESGSDIYIENPWIAGRVAAIHISNGGGGYHIVGGQLSAGQGTSSPNDNNGAVIIGKDYLTGLVGEASCDIIGTSFEGTNYTWCVRAHDQVRLNLNNVSFTPQDPSRPAIGALKMTNARNSTVAISGHSIGGYWTSSKLVSVTGNYDDCYIEESAPYTTGSSPFIAGVSTFVFSLLEQSAPVVGRTSIRRGDFSKMGRLSFPDNSVQNTAFVPANFAPLVNGQVPSNYLPQQTTSTAYNLTDNGNGTVNLTVPNGSPLTLTDNGNGTVTLTGA